MKDNAIEVLIVLATFIFLQHLEVGKASHHVKCQRTYSKVGCYGTYQNRKRYFNEMILTDRDTKSIKYSGVPIDWFHWEEYLLGLACRCVKKLNKISSGKLTIYKQFSIDNYGECWSSETDQFSGNTMSNSCIGAGFLECKTETESECVGTEITSYVYQVNNRTDVLPGHCRRVTRIVCPLSTTYANTTLIASTTAQTSMPIRTARTQDFVSQTQPTSQASSSISNSGYITAFPTDSVTQYFATLNTGGLYTPGQIPRNVTLAPTQYSFSHVSQSAAIQTETTRVFVSQTLVATDFPITLNTKAILISESVYDKSTPVVSQSYFSSHVTFVEPFTVVLSGDTTLNSGGLTENLSMPNSLGLSTSEIISQVITSSVFPSSEIPRISIEYRSSMNSSLPENGQGNQSISIIQTPAVIHSSNTQLHIGSTSAVQESVLTQTNINEQTMSSLVYRSERKSTEIGTIIENPKETRLSTADEILLTIKPTPFEESFSYRTTPLNVKSSMLNSDTLSVLETKTYQTVPNLNSTTVNTSKKPSWNALPTLSTLIQPISTILNAESVKSIFSTQISYVSTGEKVHPNTTSVFSQTSSVDPYVASSEVQEESYVKLRTSKTTDGHQGQKTLDSDSSGTLFTQVGNLSYSKRLSPTSTQALYTTQVTSSKLKQSLYSKQVPSPYSSNVKTSSLGNNTPTSKNSASVSTCTVITLMIQIMLQLMYMYAGIL